MKRSKHGLSHNRLMSMKMGGLYPIGLIHVNPGDTVQHATSALIRCSPLVTPPMHPVHVRIHHWFVPHRLVWDNFQDFITGGPDGMDASVFPTITFNAGAITVGSLADHFGLSLSPTGTANTQAQTVSALPFRGYALIFNEWYRDQDLVTKLVISKAAGNDTTTSTTLQNVAWEKDYFTTARPWTQKGPVVTIPLTGNAPIKGISVENSATAANTASNSTGVIAAADLGSGVPVWTSNSQIVRFLAQTTGVPNTSTNRPQIFADLSQVTATDIDTLRKAFAVQRYEEARARHGSRYTEYLRYLGVRSSDARLQRPEYLGGGRQTIQFSEVLQTGVTTGGAVGGVGNLAGHGISAMRSNRYRRFFEEHGYVFSFISVLPKTIYVQGIERHWMYAVKEDFWQKELEHIGQQQINLGEVFGDVAAGTGAGQFKSVFGYNDRYDEYRRTESKITGQFRASILNNWHFGRIFASAPTLNSSFVVADPALRPFADQTNDNLYVMAAHSIQARRLVSKFANSFIY